MADRRKLVAAAVALVTATPAAAGPPFLTDDPEPTDFRHWEIYAPLFEVDGSGAEYGGAVGAEINYGALPDVQLTVGLPLAFAHERAGYTSGRGDLELSVKYRFYHDNERGVSIAAFPGATLTNGRTKLERTPGDRATPHLGSERHRGLVRLERWGLCAQSGCRQS